MQKYLAGVTIPYPDHAAVFELVADFSRYGIAERKSFKNLVDDLIDFFNDDCPRHVF